MHFSRTIFLALLIFKSNSYASTVDTAVAADGRIVVTTANIFAHPLMLRGTLGDEKIEMHLQRKPDPADGGMRGTYTILNQKTGLASADILLAGEYEGNDVSMEESINGKDVSGGWDGKFVDGIFSGTWSSVSTGEEVTYPFSLKIQTSSASAKSNKQIK